MQRSDGDAQLVDRGGVNLGGDNAHGVVAGLLDTGDVGSGLTGLNAGLVLVCCVAQLSLDEGGDAGAGSLGVDAVVGQVIAVVVNDGGKEVGSGGVLSQLVAPGRGGSGNIALFGIAESNNVVNDLLSKLLACGVEGSPEGVVLVLSVELVLGIGVGAGSQDQVLTGVHAGTVLFHTFDGLSIQGAGAVIGGVAQNVHGEDDVVDGDRLAVGEDQIITQGEVVVDGAVSILGDDQVGRTIVGVVGAVVVDGLALDAIVDDGAGTIAGQQADGGHGCHILVISGLSEEGGELAGEGRVTHNQRGVGIVGSGLSAFGRCAGLCGGGSAVAAAGKNTNAHHQSQKQCKKLFAAFHWISS